VNCYHKINEVDRHVLVLWDRLLVDRLTLMDPEGRLTLEGRHDLDLKGRLTLEGRHDLDLKDRLTLMDPEGRPTLVSRHDLDPEDRLTLMDPEDRLTLEGRHDLVLMDLEDLTLDCRNLHLQTLHRNADTRCRYL
jgi:hypothetical protein